MTTPQIPTHYEILSLPPNLHREPTIPAQTLRNAYRRALLQNHPDKASSSLNTSSPHPKTRTNLYTVDQISTAYNVLGTPKLRAEYDREMRNRGMNGGVKGNEAQGFSTGVEVVDLDDLEGEEGIWWRGCRCGEERGFEVREKDLEDASAEGETEVCAGCRGCSLWLRVLFAVEAEGEDGDKG